MQRRGRPRSTRSETLMPELDEPLDAEGIRDWLIAKYVQALEIGTDAT